MTRERDYAYEALALSTNSDQDAARGELNAALKSIKEQAGIEDNLELATEIHTKARLYREALPDSLLTPTALSKHWARVQAEVKHRVVRGTNLHVSKECPMCEGDRFVVVSLRRPQQSDWMRIHGIKPAEKGYLEEVAPCPDCNPSTDTSFRRFDGRRVESPDPATVRQMLAR